MQKIKWGTQFHFVLSILFELFELKLKSNLKQYLLRFCPNFLQTKMHLARMGTPASVQINYLKLSGFEFKKTSPLHLQSDEKH